MINQIVKNEVFIRGMLVSRYKHDNKTTVVICSKNNEHSNYQYVTFFGEQKEIVDNLKIHDKVVVTATAWIFRDQDKAVNSDNLRLRGISIESQRDFSKRVFASAGVPFYGIKFSDCVRFSFNGSISTIKETSNHKAFILLAVSEEERGGFNLIPMIYAGRGNEDDIKDVLAKYKKGQVISVKGFVSQRTEKGVGENGEEQTNYNNTYFITSFLTSDMEPDFDALEE